MPLSSPPFVRHFCSLVSLSQGPYPSIRLTQASNISHQTVSLGATGSHASSSCMRSQFFSCLIIFLFPLGRPSILISIAANVRSDAFSEFVLKSYGTLVRIRIYLFCGTCRLICVPQSAAPGPCLSQIKLIKIRALLL
jgi:hypothetical protein